MVEERSELAFLIAELTKTREAMQTAEKQLVEVRIANQGVNAKLRSENSKLKNKVRRLQDYVKEMEQFEVDKISLIELKNFL